MATASSNAVSGQLDTGNFSNSSNRFLALSMSPSMQVLRMCCIPALTLSVLLIRKPSDFLHRVSIHLLYQKSLDGHAAQWG